MTSLNNYLFFGGFFVNLGACRCVLSIKRCVLIREVSSFKKGELFLLTWNLADVCPY